MKPFGPDHEVVTLSGVVTTALTFTEHTRVSCWPSKSTELVESMFTETDGAGTA